MRAILTIVFLLVALYTQAQGTRGENVPPPPPPGYQNIPKCTPTDSTGLVEMGSVEELPQFPGGDSAMFKYLSRNIHYPEIDREAYVQGKVYVQFVIEHDGRVTQAVILRGVSRAIDNEALRVVKMMPNWIPGKCSGKCVKVRYILPVNFRLN